MSSNLISSANQWSVIKEYEMLIKPVTKRIKDVFIGEGWYQWARVDTARGVIIKSSIKLNKHQEKLILSEVK